VNKYIPKVGEECEVLNTKLSCAEYEKCMPLYVGKYAIVYTSLSCTERQGSFESCNFRPIPTKPAVEREQLIEICFNNISVHAAKEIQKAGFTIPKKVKRSDVRSLVHEWSVKPCRLVVEICDLLGDLVEQDKGGDV
jgi:hypothetical protein